MKKILLLSTVISVLFLSCTKKLTSPSPVTTPKVDSLRIGLLLYLPFNNSGADSSGNENNGRIHNISSVQDRNGKSNAAYYFNGDTSSYIVVKDNNQMRLNNTDYTINIWVKIYAFDPAFGAVVFTKRYNSQAAGLNLSISNPLDIHPVGTIYFGGGGGLPGVFSNAVIDGGSWEMITIVYDHINQQASIFKNGVFDTTSQNNIVSANSTADLYFGRDNPANGTGPAYNLRGSLDDIRIYNRKLNVSDINKLFALPN